MYKDVIGKCATIYQESMDNNNGNIFDTGIEYYHRVLEELQRVPESPFRNELFLPIFGLPLLETTMVITDSLQEMFHLSEEEATIKTIHERFLFMYRLGIKKVDAHGQK